MALYEDLAEIDILSPIQPFLESGQYYITPDHTIRSKGEVAVFYDSPWIAQSPAKDRNCRLWNGIYAQHYGILSRNCFYCWKIMGRPANLDVLFALHELQKTMDVPCKAGLERRAWATHRTSYTVVWYCTMEGGLEGAKEYFKEINKAVVEVVGDGAPLYLKRGCTEMENRWGPSNDWDYAEEWTLKEDMLDAAWDMDTHAYSEGPMVQVTRKLDWIDYGRMRGDPTALKYYATLTNVGITETVTYHDKDPKVKKMPDRGMRKEKTLAEHKEKDFDHSTRLSSNERRGNGGGSGIQKTTMGPRP